jgi:hypothetical protein
MKSPEIRKQCQRTRTRDEQRTRRWRKHIIALEQPNGGATDSEIAKHDPIFNTGVSDRDHGFTTIESIEEIEAAAGAATEGEHQKSARTTAIADIFRSREELVMRATSTTSMRQLSESSEDSQLKTKDLEYLSNVREDYTNQNCKDSTFREAIRSREDIDSSDDIESFIMAEHIFRCHSTEENTAKFSHFSIQRGRQERRTFPFSEDHEDIPGECSILSHDEKIGSSEDVEDYTPV